MTTKRVEICRVTSLLICTTFIVIYSDRTFDCGDCWPLDKDRLSRLKRNYKKLEDLIEVDNDLLTELEQSACFTTQHVNAIEAGVAAAERKRCQKMLDILKLRSEADFKKFIKCLEKTQKHLVPYLTGDKGIALYKCANIMSSELKVMFYSFNRD